MNAFRLLPVLLLATFLRAENLPPVDSDLPQSEPADDAMAEVLLAHSPFTRIVSLEDTLQLTGVAYVDGKPVATFLNRETKERLTVSEEPNALGWRITEATPSTDLQDTEVHVMIGGEEVTMHYGSAQLTPGASKKGTPGVFVEGGSRGSKGDDNHVKTSSFLGEKGKEMYVSLSHDARDKLKEIIHDHLEKHPEQTQEQHSAYAQKIYAKIKAADVKSGSSPSSNGNGNNNSGGNKSPRPEMKVRKK